MLCPDGLLHQQSINGMALCLHPNVGVVLKHLLSDVAGDILNLLVGGLAAYMASSRPAGVMLLLVIA